jgi:hypothetical protein
VELVALLAKIDPTNQADDTGDTGGFLALVKEAAMSRKLQYQHGPNGQGYQTPDLWPSYFTVGKSEALRWAKENDFDLSHIQ